MLDPVAAETSFSEALYSHAVRRFGPQPTIIEWDNDLPALAALTAEAEKADRVRERVAEEDQAWCRWTTSSRE
jgi:uncharacterized protein (UPF0276 family)